MIREAVLHPNQSTGGTQAVRSAVDIIREHHTGLLERFGKDDPRVVWNSRESQEARFAVLVEVGDLHHATILDVGCGLGDFWAYLKRKNIDFADYLGLDINPQMIVSAREKYPAARFEERDLMRSPLLPNQFDYVFASGIFNMVIPGWERMTFQTLRHMFETSRRGVAVNFLSRLSGNSNPAARYSLPSEILPFVERELTHRFALRHDYRANDFTVFLYK